MRAFHIRHVVQCAVVLLHCCDLSLSAASKTPKKTSKPFDMAAYLADLSAEGKKRGYREVVYKTTPEGELRLYLAFPPGWTAKDQRPALVFFSGGGWTGTNVFSCTPEAEYFTQLGVVVGLADYRVRKHHGVMLDKCAEDARSAVRWVRGNASTLGINPQRVIAGGGSAGGHIAACTAVPDAPNSETDDLSIPCTPNGLLLYYPVASLVDGKRKNAFGQMLGDDLALKLSPARHTSKSWPPTAMFSGTADIELANGLLLHDNASKAGATIELYLIEGGGHGVIPAGPRDHRWLHHAADFLARAGLIDQRPPADEALPTEWRKYNGGSVDQLFAKPPTPSTNAKAPS